MLSDTVTQPGYPIRLVYKLPGGNLAGQRLAVVLSDPNGSYATLDTLTRFTPTAPTDSVTMAQLPYELPMQGQIFLKIVGTGLEGNPVGMRLVNPGAVSADTATFTFLGRFRGSYYYAGKRSLLWPEAAQLARSIGGHLPVITSKAENAFINRRQPFSRMWIGFNDTAQHGYVSETGEPLGYTNWRNGEPNNSGGTERYAEIQKADAGWNDEHLTTTRTFFVEVPVAGIITNAPQCAGGSIRLYIPAGRFAGKFYVGGPANFQSTLDYLNGQDSMDISVPADVFSSGLYRTTTIPYSRLEQTINTWAKPDTADFTLGAHTPSGGAYYLSRYARIMRDISYAGAGFCASFATAETQPAIDSLTAAMRHATVPSAHYIGLSDTAQEGHFVWANGDTLTATNWNIGEPNNYQNNEDYVTIDQTSGKWNDVQGAIALPFVLEAPCQAAFVRAPRGPFCGYSKYPAVLSLSGPCAADTSAIYFVLYDLLGRARDSVRAAQINSGGGYGAGVPLAVQAGVYIVAARRDGRNLASARFIVADSVANVPSIHTIPFSISTIVPPVAQDSVDWYYNMLADPSQGHGNSANFISTALVRLGGCAAYIDERIVDATRPSLANTILPAWPNPLAPGGTLHVDRASAITYTLVSSIGASIELYSRSNGTEITLPATLAPGLYVLKHGMQTARIVVR